MMDVSVWKVRGNEPPRAKCGRIAHEFLAIDDIMRNKHKHFGNLALWDKESTGKPCQ